MSPEVTIILPVYNAGKFIKDSVNSILQQTYRDFELLIINDGSTDESEDIIFSFPDSRIRYYKQENQGVSRTLNRGLSLARGTFIRRHDADDCSEPTMLEMQMNFLKSHPVIHLVSTQCAFMTPNGKIAYRYRQPKNSLFDKNKDFVLVSSDQFDQYSPIVHATVIGYTRIFREMGGYREEFLTAEDNDLWLRIIEKYPFAILNQCPYYVRINEGSATNKHGKTTRFYRELALSFARERKETGSDPLMRGEPMPEPVADLPDHGQESRAKQGRLFRGDLLNYPLKIVWDAKDWPEIFRMIRFSLRDGWRLVNTWKAIFFIVFSPRLVRWGVAVKAIFK